MCDVCRDESGGKDIGVAAVPAAPVSVMWCDNCLREQAIPRFVVETWLFSEFTISDDTEPLDMPESPPIAFGDMGIAGWVGEYAVWMGIEKKYVKIRDAFPQLWIDEYKRITEEIKKERNG